MSPNALLLTGGGGAGKTTIAQAIAGRLSTSGRATAMVDLDALAQFGPQPAPTGVLRFSDHLRIRNLAAVWQNFREAGAEYLIVSGPVITAIHRAAYTEVLSDCAVHVVRLLTPSALIAERTSLTRPGWDLQAALDDAATHAAVEDFAVPNDGTPAATAAGVLERLGWVSGDA
ncbi:hypothetical protein GCM10029976_079850 [Kribbella albertanoniae]|uniref:zeta toxin family protein n=1 Tax=Kribbella albertanoniae TaxID=1266829 RepID=UPI0014054053|nr:zeta toxin family protein [Kribbella albertanoniae]